MSHNPAFSVGPTFYALARVPTVVAFACQVRRTLLVVVAIRSYIFTIIYVVELSLMQSILRHKVV